VGGNFRLDALQAAVLLVKLKYLDGWTAKRRHNASYYDSLFQQSGLVDKGFVTPPKAVWEDSFSKRISNPKSPPATTPAMRARRGGRVASAQARRAGEIRNPKLVGHIYNQYVIRVKSRDELRGYLNEQGIGTEIYYPLALHQQICFIGLGYRKGDLPESERAAAETLALPIYPELDADRQEYVVEKVTEFYTAI
jgi:dTDP-4-amino-4,6-dideoxygalactose transaminase